MGNLGDVWIWVHGHLCVLKFSAHGECELESGSRGQGCQR